MTHFGGVDLPPAGIAAGTMSGKPNKTELPVSSQGVPKRAGPWLAAALPHVAELTELLSSSQVEMETGVHTTFRIEMERGGADGNAGRGGGPSSASVPGTEEEGRLMQDE